MEVQRLRTLYQLLSALSRAKSLQDVYDSALTSLLGSTVADRAAILLFDEDGVMRFKAWRDLSSKYREAVTGHTPWPRGAQNAEAIPVSDIEADPDLSGLRGVLTRENIRALVFVPLELDAGVCGKFMLYSAEPHEWTADEVGSAQVIASHVALVLERKRAEIARETSEQRLASVVENSFDAIITKNLNGIITSWNQAAEYLLGYTAAEAVGNPISMLAPSGRTDEMAMILARIGRGERVAHFETQRKAKDGRVLDVSLTISPIRDRDGRITGASKIMRDITEHKKAEQERLLLLARERESRATAELLNQVGPLLLAERDPEHLVQAITDIATALVGAEYGSFLHNSVDAKGEPRKLTVSGVVGKPHSGFPVHGDASRFAPAFRDGSVVRCADVTRDPGFGNASYLDGAETQRNVRSYMAAPVVSRSGEIIGGLFFAHSAPDKFELYHEVLIKGIAAQAAIAMDNARLFEQAQWAQDELKRSNEELRRTNEDLEAFVYSASHDLKEPLRTIALCSELLQRVEGDRLQGDAARYLASTIHGARTMDQLLKDLLTYMTVSRSAEGPPPVIDSGAVLKEVLQNLQASIDQAGATVISGPLPMVSMHASRLTQLFQNLIGNSLKYRGEEPPRVHVSAAEQDGWTVFSVQDNGIGIDPEYADQIFGLFKRLHGRNQYAGSGLGLAICQRIVEQYGGRIWLDTSAPGSGCLFCFAIPACVSPPADRL